MKICKDGRVWGQNNKEAGNHLGIVIGNSHSNYVKIGFPKKHWWRTGGEYKKGMVIHPRGMLGKVSWNKGKKFPQVTGVNNFNWKGGISKTKEYQRIYKQRYKSRKKGGGELTTQTIQQVYEDNIKKYETLTCYLCLKPIEFGKDTLEHKTPLSKGGTNKYDNLEIACRSCNSKKRDKTVEQFINQVSKGG